MLPSSSWSIQFTLEISHDTPTNKSIPKRMKTGIMVLLQFTTEPWFSITSTHQKCKQNTVFIQTRYRQMTRILTRCYLDIQVSWLTVFFKIQALGRMTLCLDLWAQTWKTANDHITTLPSEDWPWKSLASQCDDTQATDVWTQCSKTCRLTTTTLSTYVPYLLWKATSTSS